VLEAKVSRLEAEIALEREKANLVTPPKSSTPGDPGRLGVAAERVEGLAKKLARAGRSTASFPI
jgi:hypothetical protein